MKKDPILSLALTSIDAAMMRAKHDSKGVETLLTQDLSDAMAFILDAIAQIQGAREDAARMAGRVTLDTELLDLLAPEAEIEPPTAEEIMQGHTPLRDAYNRLWLLDKNGACCVATDIVDAWHDGGYDETYRRIAKEIHEACDRMLAEEKEGN
jgi:hypothetical protein